MMETFFDIETICQQPEEEAKAIIAETIKAPAQMKKAETIADWHNGEGKYAGEKDAAIEAAYRQTSFDGAKGQIVSIALAIEDGETVGFINDSEKELLREAFSFIKSETKGRPPYFIGHYISGFDLRFLYQRAVINNVKPSFEIKFNGRHKKDYYDTMIEWAGFKDRISQDNLCKALGIEGKPDGIDGSKVWDFYKEGRIEEIKTYNIDDVEKVRMIYKRLEFMEVSEIPGFEGTQEALNNLSIRG